MSTKDITLKFNTIDWHGLSNEKISSLYLFGAQTQPVDLNDRIRPVSAKADQHINDPTVLNGKTYDIVVKLDESTFTSSTGPARFANIAKMEFVQWFFTVEASLVSVPGVGLARRITGPDGQIIDLPVTTQHASSAGKSLSQQAALNLGFGGFSQTVSHSALNDSSQFITDDRLSRSYIYESQQWFLHNNSTYFFHEDPALRRIDTFSLHVGSEDFDFSGGSPGWAGNAIGESLDPYEIGRAVGFEYDRGKVNPGTYAHTDFQVDDSRSDPATSFLDLPIKALVFPHVLNLTDTLATPFYEKDGFQIIIPNDKPPALPEDP